MPSPPPVLAERLHNQHLTRPPRQSAAEIVARLGAVQSQDYPGARWAVAQRGRGLTDAEVERAFDAGEILRLHILRPTWHFVAPADLRWMLGLSAPRVHAANAFYAKRLELDGKTLSRCLRVITKGLAGGMHLTRTEIGEALRRARIAAAGQRLAYVMMHAELEALVCSGPRRARQFTYALVDERVPPGTTRTREEALAELARRYFSTRGPATARDFAWWSGLALRQVSEAVALNADGLEAVSIDGLTCWRVPGRSIGRTPAAGTAYLLPNYDEYLIGYKDRGFVTGGTRAPLQKGALPFPHHLIIDGRLAGDWRRRAGSLVVEVRPARRLTPADHRAIDSALARYTKFLAARLTWSVA